MRMLAKPDNMSVIDHSIDVVEGCRNVIRMVGDDLLKMFRITDKERFERLLVLSAWFHDVGKANSQFQRIILDAINRRIPIPQAVRHEAISYVCLQKPEVRAWLKKAFSEADINIVSWVAAGHHRKFPPLQDFPDGSSPEMIVHWDSEDVRLIFDGVASEFNLVDPPRWASPQIYSTRKFRRRGAHHLLDEFYGYENSVLNEAITRDIPDDERRLIAVLKIALILGDVMGSIQGRHEESIYPIIESSLNNLLDENAIIAVIDKKRRGNPLYKSQKEAGTNPERVTLVQSGCGTGKTTMAYCWALRRAIGKKLYFCYPTMGTASQGYEDYLQGEEFEGTNVYHSTSYDMMMAKIAETDLTEDQSNDEDSKNANNDIYDTFRVMPDKIVACTADTVLGLFHYYRHSILGAMSFSRGAYVFDEIHSYDDRMWNSLLHFIKLDVHCLLMTATLPKKRLLELQAALGDEKLGMPDTSNESETKPRYQKKEILAVEPDSLMPQVEGWLKEGAKILWVCNRVSECIELYQQFKDVNSEFASFCYHSRFKIGDRENIRTRMIDAFRSDKAAIAFTTQVAEMSLDVSADILVTDVCPIANMIQRLGRLNRNWLSKWGWFYLCSVSTVNPYRKTEVEHGARWAESLPQRALSQIDVAEYWREVDVDTAANQQKKVNLLDSIVETRYDPLRETAGWNVNIILPEDAAIVSANKKLAYRHRIRVHLYPSHWQMFQSWGKIDRLLDRVPAANTFHYSKEWGATWNPR